MSALKTSEPSASIECTPHAPFPVIRPVILLCARRIAYRNSPAPTGLATALLLIRPQAAWVVDTEPVAVVEAAASARDGDSVEPASNGITATIDYASVDWLVRWVLGFGGAITVLEPAEIRQAVRE
ncbi:MAG: WYL domain-containing protein, partial [Candidatus Nanopelagicales bacterium]